MDLTQFETLLDQHGSNLDVWPELDKRGAEELLAHSAEAQELLHAQKRVEILLEEATYVPIPVGLSNRIIHQVLSRSQANQTRWLQLPAKLTLIGVLPLMAGFALGLSDQESEPEIEELLTESTYFDFQSSLEDGYEP